VLVHVLDQTLRLLHPFMPFVTEEIWQQLRRAAAAEHWPEALIIADWPEPGARDEAAERAWRVDQAVARCATRARSTKCRRSAIAADVAPAGHVLAGPVLAAWRHRPGAIAFVRDSRARPLRWWWCGRHDLPTAGGLVDLDAPNARQPVGGSGADAGKCWAATLPAARHGGRRERASWSAGAQSWQLRPCGGRGPPLRRDQQPGKL
jgi:hypothetical protein